MILYLKDAERGYLLFPISSNPRGFPCHLWKRENQQGFNVTFSNLEVRGNKVDVARSTID
jgi:inorganic triphosphatase YgiF